jgi:hypothetical protein
MVEKKIRARTRAPSADKASAEKRTYFKQADFPQTTLQQAQKIAGAVIDNFAGRDGSPPDIALAIGISPTSSAWPALAGASYRLWAYGGWCQCQRDQADIPRPQARRTGGGGRRSRGSPGSNPEASHLQRILRAISKGEVSERHDREQCTSDVWSSPGSLAVCP